MMNYEIKKASFEDAVFVRLKIQKSLRLPQAPQKNPLFSCQPPLFDVNSLIKSMSKSSQESFIQKIKKQQTKPSKEQVNQWIAEKQIQIKSMISKEKKQNQAKIISCSDKIVLRPKEQLTPKSYTPTAKKQKELYSKSSSQEFNLSKSPKGKCLILRNHSIGRSFSQLKLQNRKHSIKFQHVLESHQKISERLLKTPVQTGRKVANKVLQKVNLMSSLLSRQKNFNNSNSSIFQSQVRSQQNYSKEKVLSKEKRQRYSTAIQMGSKNILGKEFTNKRISPSLNIKSEQTSKHPYKNSLYSVPGISPLKKYSQRELSPNDKKELMGKYSQLQSRLDNLLKVSNKQINERIEKDK